MPTPRFYLATLGCKVNQYESHALREAWLSYAWEETDTPANATLIIVNSCAVTAKAVADVRNTIRKLNRAAPEAGILVTGCAAEIMPDELYALPGVRHVIAQHDKSTLADVSTMRALAADLRKEYMLPQQHVPKMSRKSFPAFAVTGYDRSRAVLKVQDGCSHCCTYCIVPQTRGPARSRPLDDSLAEIKTLLNAGFREITISGINLRQYGRDLTPSHDFWDLITHLETHLAQEWTEKARVRISSLEPGQLTQKALDVLSNSTLVAPHLHLSLQSGSPTVLQRMGRGHYDPAEIITFIEKLTTVWPVFALGADILSGFPGETDEEQAETLALCQQLPFSYAHVFPYSERPGTKAIELPDSVPVPVRKERAAAIRHCISLKQQQFLQTMLQLPLVHVVPECRADQAFSSKQKYQAHTRGTNEFYVECKFTSAFRPTLPLALVPAVPAGIEKNMLLVTPLDKKTACD